MLPNFGAMLLRNEAALRPSNLILDLNVNLVTLTLREFSNVKPNIK